MNVLLLLAFTLVCRTCVSARKAETVIHAVVNQTAELPCNVAPQNQEDTLSVVRWYREDSDAAFFSRDMGEESEAAPAGALHLALGEGVARLRMRRVGLSDAGIYKCLADFQRSPSRITYVNLEVIEPPHRLWVVRADAPLERAVTASAGANSSKKIGPYYIGDTVHLNCIAYEGKPQASVSWWSSGRRLPSATAVLSQQRVRADVAPPPLRREDHGRVLTCLANNTAAVPPLAVDVVIDMHLPPSLISVRSLGAQGGHVRADEPLALQCRVLGARPPPPVFWRIGDAQLDNLEQNVTNEPSQRLVVSEVELTVDRRWDEAAVTCCVPARSRDARADQYKCASPLPLTVVYPPIVEINVDSEVDGGILHIIKGSNVTMNCTAVANPTAHKFNWFHEEDILLHIDSEGNDDSNFCQSLQLIGVTEEEAGEYTCAAENTVELSYSQPIVLDVTYPAYCEDETIAEYGLGPNEPINVTCNVKANPAPAKYGWVVMNEQAEPSIFNNQIPMNATETDASTFLYTRPNDTAYSTIFCWGINNVSGNELPATPCTVLITDQTAPRPPANCKAVKANQDITVTCDKGHDGGLPQKFTFIAKSADTNEILVSITNLEPKFMIQELAQENYKFEIIASNDKGDSILVEIDKKSIVDELADSEPINVVVDIKTLSMALCGGVLVVALVACGLVLCARDAGSRLELRAQPPRGYNTAETNCNDSDDSEFNVRRTESFRRAMARYPSKNFDVRRTSSFHSARYLHDFADHDGSHKHSDLLRHSPSCRVHSMQNIHRRREIDNFCEPLATQLPPELTYDPIRTSTFHTMPRKMRHKPTKEISDEASVITQTSDGFSLPPPPDEFGTYRAGARIRDVPKPTYTSVRTNSTKRESSKQQQAQQYSNMIVSPMNTVGLPAAGGGVYSYPDDDPRQVNTNPFDDSS